MASCYGTGMITDAFLMAESLPSFLFGWTTALATAFVPVYQAIIKNNDISKEKQYFNSIISVELFFALLSVVIGIIFGKQIIRIGAPGFNLSQQNITYSMYIICILSYVYYSHIQLLTSYLNCLEKYNWAVIPTLMLSSIQAIFIVIAYYFNYRFLALGVAFSYLAQTIIIWYYVKKTRKDIRIKVIYSEELKVTFFMALPLIVSTLITRINVMIDKIFASCLDAGSISALGYGETIRTMIYSLVSIVISSIFYPIISKIVVDKDCFALKNHITKAINAIIFVAIPLSITGIVFAKWGVAILFMRGNFDYLSVEKTAVTFSMYIIGLCPMLCRDIYINVFQANKNTKTPFVLCSFVVALNILLNFIMIKPLGYKGLALSTSISNMILIPIYYNLVKKDIGISGLNFDIMYLFKTLLASIISIIPSSVIIHHFNGYFIEINIFLKFLIFIVALLISGLLYCGISIMLRICPLEIRSIYIKVHEYMIKKGRRENK